MQLTTEVTTTTNEQPQETSKLQLKINTPENGNGDDGVDKTPRSPFQREVREWQHIDPDTGALLTKRLEADRWINGPLNKYGKISNSKNIAQPNGTQHTQRKQLEVLQASTDDGAAYQLIRTQSSSRWSSTSVSPAATSPTIPATTTTETTNNDHCHNEIRIEDDCDDDCIDVPILNVSKSNEHIPVITVTETTNTSSSSSSSTTTTTKTNKVKVDTEVISLNGLEICEVSDTEIADVDFIDCNGIVVDADDISDNIIINGDDDDDDDHDHEVYYHGKRVFDIKVQLADDYERPPVVNGNNNNINHKNNNSTQNKNNKKNNSLHTTPSIKLSNLMKSNSSASSTGSNNSKATRLSEKTKIDTNVSTSNKVSLRTVVGNKKINDVKNAEKSSSSSTSVTKLESPSKTATTTTFKTKLFDKQQQQQQEVKQESLLCSGNSLFEQPAINSGNMSRGSNNNNNHNNKNKLISVKSRVGANVVAVTNELSGSNVGVEDDNDVQQQQQQQKIKTKLTPTHSDLQQQQKQQKPQELNKNFRLYNNHGIALSINGTQHHNDELSSLVTEGNKEKTLQRTHSISTDDLSTDTNEQETLSDWRRVTKLRRSFQSNSSATSSSTATSDKNQVNIQQQQQPTVNKVNVARMRAELEQGQRLRTTNLDNMLLSKEKDTPTATSKTSTMVTAETLQDIRAKLKKLSDETLYKADYLSSNEPITLIKLTDINDRPTTNSLAARQKARASVDLIDWQNRRKSYGFEKMLPASTENKTNIRMDASTDSGLGRSGDIGNWSPTTEQSQPASRSTVVNIIPDDDLIKRHSIAVDASKYVGDSKPIHHVGGSNGGGAAAGKRVEFCKTEVHFAAESGRVNIVETDGKPPPTNNFRRRRRVSSGPLQTLVKNATTVTNNLPIKRFGDEQSYRASPDDTKVYSTNSSSSYITNANTSDNETDDNSTLRGILKNRPIKPRPYHLGENISSADVLWGVQLKPVAATTADIDNVAANNKTTISNGYSTKINLNMDEADSPHHWKQADHLQSNVMNIELHSPQLSIKHPEPIKVRPLPKPRNVSVIQTKPLETKESLKIVKEARGARKLRDHELSYFGIQILNNPTASTANNDTFKSPTSTNSLRRSLPSQRRNSIHNEPKNITKTQLIMREDQSYNDKPDLLKHNAIIYPAERKTLQTKKTLNNEDHCYENISTEKLSPVFKIKTPRESTAYDRKTDTSRDARILSEMSYNADQTLKSVSKEMSAKDQRRHSMRRPSTPLATIDERTRSQNSCNSCVAAVKVVKQQPSPAPIRHTAASRSRSSSFSSVESCPKARSRSHSGEKHVTKTTKINNTKRSPTRRTLTKSYHEDSERSHSLDSREPIKILCPNCNNDLQAKEKKTNRSHKLVSSTTRSSSREGARCKPEQTKSQRHSNDITNLSAGGSGRFQRREGTSSQNSLRKLTTALGFSKPPAVHKSTEVKELEKSYETKSRGTSNRSSERHHKTPTPTKSSSSKHKKDVPDLARYSPMTKSKNAFIINYHRSNGQSDHHIDHKPHLSGTSTTTTRIAAKHQRERNVKDRK